MNIVFLLLILGVVQGFFLVALLVRKQGNRKGNSVLVLLIYTMGYLGLVKPEIFSCVESIKE